MANYSINAVTRRAVYSGSAGTGPYAFTFELLDQNDIAGFKNATLLTLTTDYTVTLSASTGTGSVTLGVAATGSDTITLVGARDLERTTDFVTAGSLTAAALNTDLDSLVIFAQQLAEENTRALTIPITEGISGTTDMTLPAKSARLGKYLAFNETTGNPEAGPTQADVTTLAAITTDIATLADIEDGTDATDAIQTVAGISSNVTTVAGNSSNITTVAGISANVTTVAGISANVTTVAGISSDVTAVAGISSAVSAVNSNSTNINAVAGQISPTNNISTVAGLDTEITALGGISSDITTVSGISANVTTVAGISANVTTVAGISANVTTVAGISANVTTVAGIAANVTTVANNISDVNNFASIYRIGTTDPTTSLDEGDLFYNSTDNNLKFYNGSAWASITAGIAELSEDTTPQLGGNLDLNSNNITGTGDLNFTGSITLTGNVDGRDVSTDGTKLDGIATSATANPNAIDNVVEDTTPQLGGDLDTNSNHIYTANGGIVTRPNSKPLIINGDMNVAQRSTSVTGLGDGDEGYVTVDRFRHSVGAGAGRFTSKQTDITDLAGFTHALELDCTTADTSIAAGEFLTIDYRFEGQDVQLFEKGFSSAKSYTFAFYAKADAAVTYGIEFRDHDNGRHCTSTFTTATSWTRHIINIPADTTGKFNNDNGESLRIRLWLHAGATYNGGTAPTSWASQSNANSTSSSNGSFFASTDRSLFLTGVQLEVGEYDATTIPAFQHETFADSKTRCQRYFIGDSELVPTAQATSASVIQGLPQFRTEMRAAPTVTAVATGGFGLIGGSFNTTTLVTSTMGANGGRYIVNHDSSITINQFVQCGLPCTLDAEL